MTETAYIEDIAKHVGAPVRLRGWLHNRRSSGKIHFLTLRDGSGFIQCVMSKQAVGEGTTTLFRVQYFEDTTAYLTQSGQLYNEANAMALGRVYAFGPTFRAEKSKTRRHLTEFWMVEPEMAYATLDDVMTLSEQLVVYVVGRTLDKRKRELQALERDTSKLEKVQSPFPRLHYDEAVRLLQEGHERGELE